MSRRRAAGFTLIEVVIATSLLALGLAIAFGTMRSASRATVRAEECDDQIEVRPLRVSNRGLNFQLIVGCPCFDQLHPGSLFFCWPGGFH